MSVERLAVKLRAGAAGDRPSVSFNGLLGGSSPLAMMFVLRRHVCRRGPAHRPLVCRSHSPALDRTSVRIRKVRASVRFDCGTPLARF